MIIVVETLCLISMLIHSGLPFVPKFLMKHYYELKKINTSSQETMHTTRIQH